MTRLYTLFGWLVSVLIPLFLLMTAVRLLINPIFLQVEYNKPGFPADPFGFTQQDRLHWGKISVDYLVNDEGIDFLEKQRLPDGSPLYNGRELSHMLDVKVLVQQTIIAWWAVALGLLVLAGWAALGRWLRQYSAGVARGGWLTLGLIATGLLFVLLSFSALFTAFHRIFFEGESWIFLYSDTLIRLFPLVFWQDAFIFAGGFTVLGALVLILLGSYFSRRLA